MENWFFTQFLYHLPGLLSFYTPLQHTKIGGSSWSGLGGSFEFGGRGLINPWIRFTRTSHKWTFLNISIFSPIFPKNSIKFLTNGKNFFTILKNWYIFINFYKNFEKFYGVRGLRPWPPTRRPLFTRSSLVDLDSLSIQISCGR